MVLMVGEKFGMSRDTAPVVLRYVPTELPGARRGKPDG